jgi:ferric-dicitrate binding protein FerR (iron transport regulator)
VVGERRRQRRAVTWRIAAGMVIAVGASTFALRHLSPEPAQVASIVNIEGSLAVAEENAATQARAVGAPIMVGETVQTDRESRAALAFPGGLSLRLDHDTRFTIAEDDRIVLAAGAVYIDAPTENKGADELTIDTRAGSVKHLGTQYEVRTTSDSIVVSVREGRVVITGVGGSNTGEAGEVLRLGVGGGLTRSALAAVDPHWQWALQAAPDFDIDNQTLAAFLQWIARETGRHITYSSREAEAAASTVKLRGSIAGLDADAALAAVLSTTQLRRYRTGDAEIGIEIAPIDSTLPSRPTP